MLLGIIHILRLFKEGGVGQAKYDNCIMVRGWGTKYMIDNALTTVIKI